MGGNLFDSLKLYETDVDGALYRLFGDEELYRTLIKSFENDNTIYELSEAIRTKSWDEAFTAAHALKGLTSNLGFVPLSHQTGELVVLIRKGKLAEIDESFHKVLQSYNEIITAIEKSGEKEV